MKKNFSKSIATFLSCALLFGTLLDGSKVSAQKLSTSNERATQIEEYSDNPTSTALFPDTLLDWSPETDPNAKFNVSKVPLASRVQGEKVNEHQSTKAKMMSLAIANRHTLGTPSQGGSDMAVYNFTNWQYVDYLIAWAGSAGEGIIVPPSGDVTDMAHRNGVPVFGTVFFPPEVYGGKSVWVDKFVSPAGDGTFPIADKLIEMAEYYGFDGWFINEETSVSQETANNMRDFLKYFQKVKPEHLHITWYDSMVNSGGVSWQNELNYYNQDFFQEGDERVSDEIFLNFWWDQGMMEDSARVAKTLNRDPYDVFAGMDVQAYGIESQYNPENAVNPQTGELPVSLAFYCPDWTLRDGGQYDLEAFQENEQKFWINAADDPRQIAPSEGSWFSGDWYGVSKYIVERTPVTSYPFVSNFNTGVGENVYKNGAIVKAGTFNNRSVQDIMPTYKWIIDNAEGNNLKARFTYETAFNGGSSIKLSGNMTADQATYIKLYASQLATKGTEMGSVVTKGASKVELVLETVEDQDAIVLESQARESDNLNSWALDQFDLSALAGKTVKSIGLNLYSAESAETAIYLGHISLLDSENVDFEVSPVTDAAVSGKTVQDDETESARLTWQSAGNNTEMYNVYREVDGEQQLVGSTSNLSLVLLNQKRSLEDDVLYTIVPVDTLGEEHFDKDAEVVYTFNKLTAPDITINANTTFVMTGEQVSLSAKYSPSTEDVKWTINGADIISETMDQAVVSFHKAGVYTVCAEAINRVGSNKVVKENYIQVYDENSNLTVENLSILPESIGIDGSGYTNPSEGYDFALDDNLDTKWCDNSSDNPYMIVDLGAVKTITGFTLYNAAAGGEDAEWNSKDYDISVSSDGVDFVNVVEHRNNKEDISVDSIAKTEARYVKLYLHRAEQNGNTSRIYEFQIWGINGSDVKVGENAELISRLRDLYYEGTAKAAEDYVPESFATLEEALLAAKDTLDANAGEASEIEAQIAALEEALKGLISVQEQAMTNAEEKLQAAIDSANELKNQELTPEQIEELDAAIADAETALADEERTVESLEQATAKLNSRVDEIMNPSAPEVDKSELETLIKMLSQLQEDEYTTESFAVLNNALSLAKNVLADENAEQSQVDAMVNELKNARDGLIKQIGVNKSALEEAVANAESLDSSDYSKESFAKLVDTVDKAKLLLVDPNASQADIDSAQEEIAKMIQSLVAAEPSEPSLPDVEDPVKPLPEKLKLTITDEKTRIKLDETAKFTINSNPEYLLSVKIAGNEIDRKLYTVEEGSTILTLKNELIRKLGVGKQELSVEYAESEKIQGGQLSVNFEIVGDEAQGEDVVKTGENIAPILINMTLLLAIAFVLVEVRKRYLEQR